MVVTSEYRAPQTELGTAMRMAWWSYVRRVDMEMESQGFPERIASMNYVFALYAQPEPITISEMGRLFAISRQAASKIVADLRSRGYAEATQSTADQREKVVELTPRAIEFMTARLKAASAVDREIRKRIGDAQFDQVLSALGAIGEVATGKGDLDPTYLYRSPKLW